MKKLLLGLVAATVSTSSAAQQISVRPLEDLRLRWEDVDQDGIAKHATAITLRSRTGLEVSTGEWRLLGEVEATVPLVEDYFSGLNGKPQFPLVADPEDFELNRLQLQYRGLPDTVVTAGRQQINIEDERFVGSSGWRQNEQTFDAVRIQHGRSRNLQLDLSYAWSDRTIWGFHGTGARPGAVHGSNIFAVGSYPTPLGRLSAFAFVVDQDEAAVQNYRQSSQSFGTRLTGNHPFSKLLTLNYALSYARQTNYGRNPNHYSANYYLLDGNLEFATAKFGVGYEVLGADKGLPFTSFQTPLATLHKFQGWADKFLVTPPNGIRDLYGSAGYTVKKPLGLDKVSAQVVFHRFESDRLKQHYGNEWDTSIVAKKGSWTATAKLASYVADRFASDTRKLWLQLEWIY